MHRATRDSCSVWRTSCGCRAVTWRAKTQSAAAWKCVAACGVETGGDHSTAGTGNVWSSCGF